ncbi:hypothetical protein EVAR_91829_1 [Eumeta japonica]|uniref:Integrase zinc-binding domain-containing protein n=2 Tax=Eumeta variegata TaxID=151549 RepID=A0A4C2A5F8_EUMVA|nr:hypothetical protein EVAR_91829_1 [Eumeta japonica]
MEIDENGVLRLKGRIKAAKDVSFTLNRPAVLSGDSSIAKLIMKHYHERFNHGNHNTVMNEIRQKYYITSLRSKLRKIAHECQWCRINRSLPKMPSAEGDLPPERLRHHQPPFTCTGVDYFGPMSVTIGRRHEKRYGALFTCLTTRAVHIELAESLSSDSMILALRRFIARRGTPRVMYSDNGTNFVGANKELMNIQEVHEKMKKEADVRTITWEVHTSRRSEHGWRLGAFEAEHIVNSRPLTEVDVEPAEAEGLTPNHFLIGRSGAAAAGHFDDNVLLGPANWRTCQRLADHFWQRWLREYLPTLVPPGARRPYMPRAGRGRHRADLRVVDVETTGGVLRRPTSKIVVLVSAEATAVPCPEEPWVQSNLNPIRSKCKERHQLEEVTLSLHHLDLVEYIAAKKLRKQFYACHTILMVLVVLDSPKASGKSTSQRSSDAKKPSAMLQKRQLSLQPRRKKVHDIVVVKEAVSNPDIHMDEHIRRLQVWTIGRGSAGIPLPGTPGCLPTAVTDQTTLVARVKETDEIIIPCHAMVDRQRQNATNAERLYTSEEITPGVQVLAGKVICWLAPYNIIDFEDSRTVLLLHSLKTRPKDKAAMISQGYAPNSRTIRSYAGQVMEKTAYRSKLVLDFSHQITNMDSQNV